MACFCRMAPATGAVRIRDQRHEENPRDRCAGVRHLSRAPDPRPRRGRAHRQNEVRPPRRQSPGAGPGVRPRVHHQPEPRLFGGREFASCGSSADTPLAVRRFAAGHRLPRAAGVWLPGPSGGEPRTARPEALVRAVQPPDAAAPAGAAASGGGHPDPPAGRWQPLSVPKRTDIESILIIGAGPIVIGQACEFDYSGAQACKALREEGYRVILVNSNPATIMTDPEMADSVYIEPINWRTIARIIEKERPDALLPTMGGQTALNTALDLAREGVLEKYQVELIAASRAAIDMAEDRELFRNAMREIGLETPQSQIARSLDEALAIAGEMGYPVVVRPSFTLGGSGSGIAYNREELEEIVARGLDASPTGEGLLEESVIGWKEFEMEVVRDHRDNCIIVCSIENLDPMGVHTGDSITIAPALTLTDKEYQMMRDASIAVLREIGVETGGSNVQFAVNPQDGRLVVIEMNPRVSRSSALASKATGFPIAKVAAKLAVGYTLDEIANDITGGAMPASFEPTIDYVVTKVPRFAFEKFPGAEPVLTTSMKSVGEAMAIGRTFQESLQKALRSLETGLTGLDEIAIEGLGQGDDKNAIRAALGTPTPERILKVAQAMRLGIDDEQIHASCQIDRWFLAEIRGIVEMEG